MDDSEMSGVSGSPAGRQWVVVCNLWTEGERRQPDESQPTTPRLIPRQLCLG